MRALEEQHKKHRRTRDSRRIVRGDAREEEESGERAFDWEERRTGDGGTGDSKRDGVENGPQEGLAHRVASIKRRGIDGRKGSERAYDREGGRPAQRGSDAPPRQDAMMGGCEYEANKEGGCECTMEDGCEWTMAPPPATPDVPFPTYPFLPSLDSTRRRLRVLEVPRRSSQNGAGGLWLEATMEGGFLGQDLQIQGDGGRKERSAAVRFDARSTELWGRDSDVRWIYQRPLKVDGFFLKRDGESGNYKKLQEGPDPKHAPGNALRGTAILRLGDPHSFFRGGRRRNKELENAGYFYSTYTLTQGSKFPGGPAARGPPSSLVDRYFTAMERVPGCFIFQAQLPGNYGSPRLFPILVSDCSAWFGAGKT
ncbi:hypothetical protein FB451DRAFT_1377434 [Mycena latifolia]|nr:hypothetical protein FB451DRAFT_1377434 [Mycena latifolia]